MMDENLIILIDDDDIYRDVLEKYIGKLNKRIVTYDNGLDAIEYIKNLSVKPYLVMIDINMPNVNGWETMKYLLDYDNNLNIIIVSSTKVNDNDLNNLNDEFDGNIFHMIKPLSKKQLKHIINV